MERHNRRHQAKLQREGMDAAAKRRPKGTQKRARKRALLGPRWFRRNQCNSFVSDETRTRDLCRDSGPLIGFTTTYKTAGTAKGRLSRSESYKTLRAVGWIVG